MGQGSGGARAEGSGREGPEGWEVREDGAWRVSLGEWNGLD